MTKFTYHLTKFQKLFGVEPRSPEMIDNFGDESNQML